MHVHASWPGLSWLVPAIHVFLARRQDVNARHKAGHDDFTTECSLAQLFFSPDISGPNNSQLSPLNRII
jgi:hypothetical protein